MTASVMVFKAVNAVKPSVKNMVWMVGGIAVSAVFAVSAQQYMSSATPTEEDCALRDAMDRVINDKVRMIALTNPDPSKYFQVGGASSCLGDFSLANLDLSRLIPDPLGLLTGAVIDAATKLATAAISKVCAAARSTIGSTIGQYNTAINMVNGSPNSGGLIKGTIDTAIGVEASNLGDKFGVDYNKSAPVPTDILSGVQLRGGELYSNSTNGTSGGNNKTVSVLAGNGANAVDLTRAAGALEQQRISLDNARRFAAGLSDDTGAAVVKQAEAAYSAASSTFQTVRERVNGSATSSASGQQATPVAPATVGSSIFGR